MSISESAPGGSNSSQIGYNSSLGEGFDLPGTLGPGVGILPDIANVFFRQIDSNGGAVQGRYLFVSEVAEVPEPSSLAPLGPGLLGLALLHRKIRHSARRSNHAVVISKSASRK